MVIAFLISVAGCCGALMALGIFGIVFWNAFVSKLKKDNLVVRVTRKRMFIICAAVSLLFNAVYFGIALSR